MNFKQTLGIVTTAIGLGIIPNVANAAIIGVDFGPIGSSTPTNWNLVTGAGTTNNLIEEETGSTTDVNITVSSNTFGRSVSNAGDVNGDGIDDLIIGAEGADPNGNSYAGETYVVFGSESFGDTLNLSSLNGSNGFVINGIDARDYSGRSVSNAGDINGDGIDDIIIGAFLADRNGNSLLGQTYVVFGSESFDSTLNLSSLDGSNGFVISGIDARDYSGRSVSNAGDVNGDGIDDFIIGAYGAEPNGNRFAGETYVIFGSESFGNTLNLSSLDGNNGFVINGIDEFDNSGFSVSNAGDINGDGFDDLIIGAFLAQPNGNIDAGETYVVFGSSSFEDTLNLSSLDGSNGFVINGIDEFDNSGFSVSNAGDINGDGFDDLIIGAFFADPNGNEDAGETYVIFGSESFGSTLNLSSLNGNNGFVINGIDAGDNSGFSVSNAGDVNGDGIDDLIIGADPAEANGNSYAGQTYVIFGGQNNNSNSLLSVTAEVDSNSLTETPLVTDQGIETFFVEVKLDEPVTDLPGLIINYDVTGTATLGEDYYISQTDISTTDGSFPTNSIFIPQGADSANIYITPLADAIVEGDETIEITLQSETVFGLFGDPLENNIFVNSGTTTITLTDSEDYTAGVAIVDIFGEEVTTNNPLVINENGETIYSVKLTSQPLNDVTVEFNNGGTNLTTIAFNENNWDSYQEIRLTGIENPLDIDVTATSSDLNYQLTSTITVTNESERNRIRVTEGGSPQPEEVPIVSIVAVEDANEGDTTPGEYLIPDSALQKVALNTTSLGLIIKYNCLSS